MSGGVALSEPKKESHPNGSYRRIKAQLIKARLPDDTDKVLVMPRIPNPHSPKNSRSRKGFFRST